MGKLSPRGETGRCYRRRDLRCACLENLDGCPGLTGEDGAELGPAGDPPFRGVLAQRHFQEEHWESAAKQEDEVGDEKRTCGRETGTGSEPCRLFSG